jgi:hypothetical protein
MALPARDISATPIELTPDGPDHYSANAVSFPAAGSWTLTVVVTTGAGATVRFLAQVAIAP